MKFIINKEYFDKGLTTALKVNNSKAILPSLRNLKLSLKEDSFNIIASNGETSIIVALPLVDSQGNKLITITEAGEILIPGKVADIVRKMESSEVILEVIDDSMLKINDSKSSFNLNIVDVNEYPDLDFSYDSSKTVVFSGEEFSKTIDQVAFAAATKTSKAILMAVNIVGSENSITFSATDAARLSRKIAAVSNQNSFVVNVPAKILQDVARMIEPNSNIKLSFDEKRIVFDLGNTKIFSSLINGDFPNFSNVINKTFEYSLQVNSNELINALERVALLFTDRDTVAKLKVTSDSCKIYSKSNLVGTTEESLQLFKYEGEPLEISFRCDFIIEAIRAIGEDDVLLKLSNGLKPFMVKSTKEDSTLVQIITPLRVYD